MRVPFGFWKTSVPAFNPATLPSIACWIDASNSSSVTQSGGLISQINDLSGNGDNASQSTGTNKPTYSSAVQNGLNAMLFSDPSFLSFVNSTGTLPAFSVAFIFKTPSSVGGTMDINNFNNSAGIALTAAPHIYSDWGGISGDPDVTTGTLSTNTWYRYFSVWDSTQGTAANRLRVYINNVDVSVVNATGSGNLGNTTKFLGGRGGSGSLQGYIGEYIFTNAAFTSTDRSNLDTYWKTKWGL